MKTLETAANKAIDLLNNADIRGTDMVMSVLRVAGCIPYIDGLPTRDGVSLRDGEHRVRLSRDGGKWWKL